MVQVLISLIVLLFVVALLMRITFGRWTLLAREQRRSQALAVAEAASERAHGCLQALGWKCGDGLPPDCAACGDPACSSTFGTFDLTVPGGQGAFNVTVALTGAPPSCGVQATCNSCL